MTGRRLYLLVPLLAACGGEGTRVISADFDAAPGLEAGQAVNYRGVAVGEVRKVSFTAAGVRAELAIERADAPVRSADTAILRTVGVFGDPVIDIVPGPASAPPASGTTVLPGRPAIGLTPDG